MGGRREPAVKRCKKGQILNSHDPFISKKRHINPIHWYFPPFYPDLLEHILTQLKPPQLREHHLIDSLLGVQNTITRKWYLLQVWGIDKHQSLNRLYKIVIQAQNFELRELDSCKVFEVKMVEDGFGYGEFLDAGRKDVL